ncbi:DUF6304 family protein [Flammeovirgaceae bacterium SG7u.111]|nr:DUF6304 family protein [Flammeovirgaceae bacterium SG7u.132]WPO33200.1 DUF6304 family protein [Flammeovirgaceae bacterium SG7u.111]
MIEYAAKYKDKFGEEKTKVYSDGTTMHLVLRGIKFEGSDFEMLEGKVDDKKFEYEKYQESCLGDLTNFELEIDFPIIIIWNNDPVIGNLNASIVTGKESNVFLELKTKFGKFQNTKNCGWFEDALVEIQKMLPQKAQIKTCLSCKYSSYHPVGSGMFGGLSCFKNLRLEADNICNKDDLMILWEKGCREKTIFNVQEVFDCSEHQFITKNDWTYKDWT